MPYSINPELDAVKARIAAVPMERQRAYENDTHDCILPERARAKFDRAADAFELSEREYLRFDYMRSQSRELFEQDLTGRLFDYDLARFGRLILPLNYWNVWSRDLAAHTERALAAFDRAAARYGRNPVRGVAA